MPEQIDDANTDGAPSRVITRIVSPGQETDYNEWLVRALNEGLAFPGCLGITVLPPDPGQGNVHRLVHTFADTAALRSWDGSAVRRDIAAAADAFSTSAPPGFGGASPSPPSTQPSPPQPPQPPKWKMALSTFVVAYILTAIIIPREQAWIPATWSFYAVNVLTNLLLAVGITYVGLPLVNRLLGRWLNAT